jgi:lipopolysaccharide transport system permease protein
VPCDVVTSNGHCGTLGSVDEPGITHIRQPRGWVPIDANELWSFRELLFFLAWRDVKVRYKQTAIGAAWAILQPVLTMVVFTVFLGRLAGVPSDGAPYPIFTYSALLPWTFFANGLIQSSGSVVANANLISKVYFPRIMIPLASVLAGVFDFLIASIVLGGLMAFYGVPLTPRAMMSLVFLALAFVVTFGVGLWLAALNVRFRDVRHAVPFLTQIWLFASPVAYPTGLLGDRWKLVYGLNPMVGVIDGFRWSLLAGDRQLGPDVVVSSVVAVLLLVGGLVFFQRMERSFADVV